MSTKVSIFLFLILASSTARCQSIYINLVPEYSSLSSCAISPLSTIVRGMGAGCGDGSALTSYSCFCTDSSSYFSSMISSVVAVQCATDPSQASSAVNVFDSYCAVGTSSQSYPKQTLTSSSSSQHTATSSPTATPLNTATNTQSLPTTTTSTSKTAGPPVGNGSSNLAGRYTYSRSLALVLSLVAAALAA